MYVQFPNFKTWNQKSDPTNVKGISGLGMLIHCQVEAHRNSPWQPFLIAPNVCGQKLWSHLATISYNIIKIYFNHETSIECIGRWKIFTGSQVLSTGRYYHRKHLVMGSHEPDDPIPSLDPKSRAKTRKKTQKKQKKWKKVSICVFFWWEEHLLVTSVFGTGRPCETFQALQLSAEALDQLSAGKKLSA